MLTGAKWYSHFLFRLLPGFRILFFQTLNANSKLLIQWLPTFSSIKSGNCSRLVGICFLSYTWEKIWCVYCKSVRLLCTCARSVIVSMSGKPASCGGHLLLECVLTALSSVDFPTRPSSAGGKEGRECVNVPQAEVIRGEKHDRSKVYFMFNTRGFWMRGSH